VLQNRGIGTKYHKMSLTDYPDPSASTIKAWLENESEDHLKAGKGVIFFSVKQEGYDLAVLTARALILSGYTKLKAIDFNFCMEDEVLAEIGQEKPPLLILNFFPDSSFIQTDKYKRFETILNYYLDNCIPILLHIPAEQDGPSEEYGTLISQVFLDRLLKNSKIF
jgi:hypothetical protein